MKDVYVIKVKTRPPLTSLYPSERRYSASTVGGLALVHLGLGVLGMLLGALARSIQGPILGLASLAPFTSGLLAWRRWYIDRNITIFFYGSLFTALIAILCSLGTVIDIVVVTEATRTAPTSSSSLWRLENVFAFRGYGDDDDIQNNNNNNNNNNRDDGDHRTMIDHYLNITDYTSGIFRGGFFTLWKSGDPRDFRANIVIDLNLLVACALEAFWSMLSVRISLRGMRNLNGSERPAANDYVEPDIADDSPRRIHAARDFGKKPPPPPDPRLIVERRRGSSNGDEEFRFSDVDAASGPRLPLPESNTEFRERVERFLANQAAHRIVEGSCS